MLGDNFYGPQGAADLENKFARPYRPLLDAGVTFRAALGNHDDLATINYPPINMEGRRYYTYVRRERAVRGAGHQRAGRGAADLGPDHAAAGASNPGKSRTSTIRCTATPAVTGRTSTFGCCWSRCCCEFGVQVVFSGHDHVYERLKPQRGIQYFVAGSGGQLRKGDFRARTPRPRASTRTRPSCSSRFPAMTFTSRPCPGRALTVDSGVIRRRANVGS